MCLRGFVAAREHNNHDVAAPCEIQPVAGADIDSHFRNLAADGLLVAEVTRFGLAQSRSDLDLGALIFDAIRPILKFLRQ